MFTNDSSLNRYFNLRPQRLSKQKKQTLTPKNNTRPSKAIHCYRYCSLRTTEYMHNQVRTRKEISPLLVYSKYHVMQLSEMIHKRSHDKRLQELH